MLVRRIARPLLATWFVGEGVDAVRRPAPHVARTEAAWQELGRRIDLPATPSTAQLTTLVRVHGGFMTLAGLMLATGRAPRAAALVLAGLTVPLAVVNQPFGGTGRVVATASDRERAGGRRSFGRPIGATGGVATAQVAEGGADRAALRERFLRSLSMLGGALIAGVDHEGRPGPAWRVEHARADRAAAREARSAVAAATRQARAATRELRRSAD